jgi:hypothetical protein
MLSYPIYIIDLPSGGCRVVFPEGKEDLNHADFWSDVVATMVAKLYGIPLQYVEELKNAPYCMRRARISSSGSVYYGEEQSDMLMEVIRLAVDDQNLEWKFDEHESRTDYDMQMLANARCR